MAYLVLLILLFFLCISWTSSRSFDADFLQCMSSSIDGNFLYSSGNSKFSQLLQSQNRRWINSSTYQKPLHIITPSHEAEIQSALRCAQTHGLQIRTRSGGHDYEGLSSHGDAPFVLLDLVNMRSIDINLKDETAWVQAGATIGELYYAIARKSPVHGFPAGLCPSVGVGGHFSGGGFGTLLRKYGTAADNVVDAYLIDAFGRLLDRASMGEDLFWAIRGGGGASFGIIISWKIKLVRVPPKITVFNIHRRIDQSTTSLIHRWQYVAPKLQADVFQRILVQIYTGTLQASFSSLFLGRVEELMQLMNSSLPKLGLQREDCREMSWAESILFFYNLDGRPLKTLLDRTHVDSSFSKSKSDFVTHPMPKEAFEGTWKRFLEEEAAFFIMDAFGGRMNEIAETEIPFPHRKGNLYNVQYIVKWDSEDIRVANRHVHWMRMLYKYMEPYVSANPRAAYLNYRDLDLGTKRKLNSSYLEASVWGEKYFKGNFRRLAEVKARVDPRNFFRNEQSIPPLPPQKRGGT